MYRATPVARYISHSLGPRPWALCPPPSALGPMPSGNTRSPVAVLALAVLGISFGGPLVRLSHAHPIVIAVWRLGFSLAIIAIFLVASRGWRQWGVLLPKDWGLAVAAGVTLAIHFWSWNASVGLTTVAASVVQIGRASCRERV